MTSSVFLNGEFVTPADAKISVMDRGFLFGDGVYEVIPVYQGRAFRLREHLVRLQQSLAEIRLSVTMTEQAWISLIEELIARNIHQSPDLSLYLQVTRGAAKTRDHGFPAEVSPTLFMMANPLVPPPELAQVSGIKTITLPDNRWTRCNIKAICLLPNVLLKQQALDQGVEDVILLRDGQVTESAAANVFIVKDECVVTPPKSRLILGGITRDLVVEMAQQGSFECREQEISEQQLRRADEVWVTSSTREIVPVIEIDGVPVGDGKIGTMWYNVARCFREYKANLAG